MIFSLNSEISWNLWSKILLLLPLLSPEAPNSNRLAISFHNMTCPHTNICQCTQACAHTHTHTHTHIMYLLFDCCLLKYYCFSARQQKVFRTVLMKIKWQQNWVAGEKWRKDIGGRIEGNYEQRSPGESKGYPLQYSCLENCMDRRAYWATVHGVTKSWTQLSD